MIRTIAQAWKIADIRKKIIFTLLMLLVFRLGSNIPVPGIDRDILKEVFSEIQDCLVCLTYSQEERSATLPYLP
jgi:preprotein translocase subunit SecY